MEKAQQGQRYHHIQHREDGEEIYASRGRNVKAQAEKGWNFFQSFLVNAPLDSIVVDLGAPQEKPGETFPEYLPPSMLHQAVLDAASAVVKVFGSRTVFEAWRAEKQADKPEQREAYLLNHTRYKNDPSFQDNFPILKTLRPQIIDKWDAQTIHFPTFAWARRLERAGVTLPSIWDSISDQDHKRLAGINAGVRYVGQISTSDLSSNRF